MEIVVGNKWTQSSSRYRKKRNKIQTTFKSGSLAQSHRMISKYPINKWKEVWIPFSDLFMTAFEWSFFILVVEHCPSMLDVRLTSFNFIQLSINKNHHFNESFWSRFNFNGKTNGTICNRLQYSKSTISSTSEGTRNVTKTTSKFEIPMIRNLSVIS